MIQVYTGNGKGKTTAALGLALRAAGAGLRVYIGQFIKKDGYSELKSIGKIGRIKIEQYGRGCFIKGKPRREDIEAACKGFRRARGIVIGGKYDLVILDEINVALDLGLLPVAKLLSLLKSAPAQKELVLTGRKADPRIMKRADLVSEIRNIKHYHKRGVRARKGIEF